MEWMGQGLRDERAPAWGRTRKRPEGRGGAGLWEPSVCPAPPSPRSPRLPAGAPSPESGARSERSAGTGLPPLPGECRAPLPSALARAPAQIPVILWGGGGVSLPCARPRAGLVPGPAARPLPEAPPVPRAFPALPPGFTCRRPGCLPCPCVRSPASGVPSPPVPWLPSPLLDPVCRGRGRSSRETRTATVPAAPLQAHAPRSGRRRRARPEAGGRWAARLGWVPPCRDRGLGGGCGQQTRSEREALGVRGSKSEGACARGPGRGPPEVGSAMAPPGRWAARCGSAAGRAGPTSRGPGNGAPHLQGLAAVPWSPPRPSPEGSARPESSPMCCLLTQGPSGASPAQLPGTLSQAWKLTWSPEEGLGPGAPAGPRVRPLCREQFPAGGGPGSLKWAVVDSINDDDPPWVPSRMTQISQKVCWRQNTALETSCGSRSPCWD